MWVKALGGGGHPSNKGCDKAEGKVGPNFRNVLIHALSDIKPCLKFES